MIDSTKGIETNNRNVAYIGDKFALKTMSLKNNLLYFCWISIFYYINSQFKKHFLKTDYKDLIQTLKMTIHK